MSTWPGEKHYPECPRSGLFSDPGRWDVCNCGELRDAYEDIAADMAYDQRREDAL